MTKQEFKTSVGQNKIFSCKWINNKGEVSVLKRGILGTNAWRHTNIATQGSVNEHGKYVLAYRIGNGLSNDNRRCVNINPETVFEVNGNSIREWEIHA